jgi:hypothetical protein
MDPYDVLDEWEAMELYNALGDWEAMVNVLFDWKEGNPYYKACLNKDLETAKKLIKEGYFAENTYLWVEPYTSACDMECFCGTKPVHQVMNRHCNMGFDKFVKLFDYGLFPMEYVIDQNYSIKLFLSKNAIEFFLNNREFMNEKGFSV